MIKLSPMLGALLAAAVIVQPLSASAADLAAVPASLAGSVASQGFDGVVEAVRQTIVAAQVAGAVVQIDVKVGDSVKAGQLLLRIDARSADQDAAASDAQVQAARASQTLASQEYTRQKQLFQKNYISQAALERARATFEAAQAQVAAQIAQAAAARTQTGLHVVRAPYGGVVAEVPVALGDMAMPGRALVTIYDPGALRVTAAVAQTAQAQSAPGQPVRVELPGLPAPRQWIVPARVQVLPLVDAATHTVQIRADLPTATQGVAPGMFARLWLTSGTAAAGLTVPLDSVVRRAEMTGLYVIDSTGRPLLRQVRLGHVEGTRVEILSGLSAGERVASDPQAAARVR